MPKYYSLDLRQKAILMVNKGKSVRLVAKELDVGKSSIYEWIDRDKKNDLKPHKSGHKKSWKVDENKVLEYLDLNKDAYLREIASEFNLTPSGVFRLLSKSKITRKKNYTLPTKRSKSKTGILKSNNGYS
jgi:putative transposase